MTIGLDAGDVLAVGQLDIGPDETAGELETRLGVLGAKLAVDTVDRLANGEVPAFVQDKAALATKAPKLTKEMGLIDWAQPAAAVWNHIRARMQPVADRVHVLAPAEREAAAAHRRAGEAGRGICGRGRHGSS